MGRKKVWMEITLEETHPGTWFSKACVLTDDQVRELEAEATRAGVKPSFDPAEVARRSVDEQLEGLMSLGESSLKAHAGRELGDDELDRVYELILSLTGRELGDDELDRVYELILSLTGRLRA